jgi:hypothetical protein
VDAAARETNAACSRTISPRRAREVCLKDVLSSC